MPPRPWGCAPSAAAPVRSRCRSCAWAATLASPTSKVTGRSPRSLLPTFTCSGTISTPCTAIAPALANSMLIRAFGAAHVEHGLAPRLHEQPIQAVELLVERAVARPPGWRTTPSVVFSHRHATPFLEFFQGKLIVGQDLEEAVRSSRLGISGCATRSDVSGPVRSVRGAALADRRDAFVERGDRAGRTPRHHQRRVVEILAVRRRPSSCRAATVARGRAGRSPQALSFSTVSRSQSPFAAERRLHEVVRLRDHDDLAIGGLCRQSLTVMPSLAKRSPVLVFPVKVYL